MSASIDREPRTFADEQEQVHDLGGYTEDDLGQYLASLTGREQQATILLLRRVREEHERRAKQARTTEQLVREILHAHANVGLEDTTEPTDTWDGPVEAPRRTVGRDNY